MVWCRMQEAITWANFDQDMCVTTSQWVNSLLIRTGSIIQLNCSSDIEDNLINMDEWLPLMQQKIEYNPKKKLFTPKRCLHIMESNFLQYV